MQSINNLQDVIKVYNIYKNQYKTVKKSIEFGEKIIQVTGWGVYSNFINNTDFKNIILTFEQLEKLEKISKLKLDYKIKITYFNLELFEEKKKFDFEINNKKLELISKKTKFEFKVFINKLNSNYENEILNENQNNLENKEFIGKLTAAEVTKLLNIAKNQKAHENDYLMNNFKNIFISNGKYHITNSYQMITNYINLKDCTLNIEKLTEHKNCEFLNIYADADAYYYESNLITNKVLKKDCNSNLEHTLKIYNEFQFNLNINNCFYVNITNWKYNKIDKIRLNFADLIITYIDINENEFENKLNVTADNLGPEIKELPIIEFKYDNFINIFNLIEIKDCVLIKISNEVNKPIFIENHFVMPIRNYNYVEYTKKDYETTFTPVIQIKEIKTTKTKKPKTMNLKKEIKTKPIKSKYYEPVTEEIKEEIKENLEVKNEVMEIAPKIDLKVEKIEIEPVTQIKKRSVHKELKPVKKEVKNELSETVITPNFDIIDFLYITCFNELENLEFYNTDYKNNRLYLDNCELSFNQIKDKIEVTELDVNCKLHFYNIKDKKELLNLVRSKIKDAA